MYNNPLQTYKVTATIVVTPNAHDDAEALEIGTDCLNLSHDDITVEEVD